METQVQRKPVNLVLLALSIIGISGLIGASTNLVNGLISEEYFRRIMGWEFPGIWIAAIFQGIFEGLIYGFIFSFVFTVGFANITRMKADWAFVKPILKQIILLIFGCWIIGGMAAVLWVLVFPEASRKVLYGLPKEKMASLRYAWVAGSIWGEMLGGFLAAVWGLRQTNLRWKNRTGLKN